MSDLFVRRATGLVRAWSVFDAFVYAFFSINLVTLGLYIFAFAPSIQGGHLVPAIMISGLFILFEVAVYAMLISIMPRAGGDYVWQSRILGGGIGFVLGITGWVFILWHWVPVYGNMLVYEVFVPILATLGSVFNSRGLIDAAVWFQGRTGLFVGAMAVIAFAFFVNSIGMKGYARVQKACFWVGIAGLLTVFLVLLAGNQSSFMNAFNNYVAAHFGGSGKTYNEILNLSSKNGYTPIPWNKMPIAASLPLIPMVVFFNLWPNWGCTLYGEVRGASEFKRNFWGMALAVISTTILAVILLALVGRTMGWNFYHAANFEFYKGDSPLSIYPYVGYLAAMLTPNPILQLWILVSLSAWFFGWAGTVFLSSTRVLFAAAFDRVLPEWVANINERTHSPVNALLLMTVPAIILSILYSYTSNFATFTLDTTVVIAITFLGTTIAAAVLPWKDPDLFKASPVARYRLGGVPWITIAGVVFLVFLLYNLYMWITDAVYGVNNPISAAYMLFFYLLSVAIYYWSKSRRMKQGIDLNMVYRNIPVE